MEIAKHDSEKDYEGYCCFHGGKCVEVSFIINQKGLVTNNSIAKRLKCSIEELQNIKDDHEIWKIIGHYLAVFCANLAYTLSPEVIILGGGVMNRKILFDII